MKHYPLVLVTLFVVTLGAWRIYAVPPVQTTTQQLKPFMRQKLEHSKGILEALALEDFDQLAKNAQSLSLLSLESSWNVLTTEEYIKKSEEFRRACQSIHEAAHQKNVDRATLGFVDLTMRCVECHKYLRNEGVLPKTP